MTSEKNDILAVIPTYNNEKTLAQVIGDVRRYCTDVLVVNDGSTDSTPEIIAGTGVEAISYAPNRGKGYALRRALRYAAEHGYTAFTSTLLASTYQNHEAIAAAAEMYARQYGVEFLYRDFRSNFRAGNQRARELGFYMQKYCGCVFSEADRYQKQIDRDRAKFDAEEAARQG